MLICDGRKSLTISAIEVDSFSRQLLIMEFLHDPLRYLYGYPDPC
jgi:hypothetical protein